MARTLRETLFGLPSPATLRKDRLAALERALVLKEDELDEAGLRVLDAEMHVSRVEEELDVIRARIETLRADLGETRGPSLDGNELNTECGTRGGPYTGEGVFKLQQVPLDPQESLEAAADRRRRKTKEST